MSLQKLYLLTFPNLVATTDIKWTHFVHIGVLSGLFCLFWLNLRSRSRKSFCLIFKNRLYDLGPWPNITRAVGLGGQKGADKDRRMNSRGLQEGPMEMPHAPAPEFWCHTPLNITPISHAVEQQPWKPFLCVLSLSVLSFSWKWPPSKRFFFFTALSQWK